MYREGRTIAAIATPPGEGGVAIIRISGPAAVETASTIYTGPLATYKTHTLHRGHIVDGTEIVDDVLIVTMRAPNSYTGEETVEIYCHGGSLITRRVLKTVLKAGAEPALPGEFTFKAYMNGKLDLAQAEAVQTLIGAKNELALAAAERQLQGRLSTQISAFQQQLLNVAAILEAWVDFPDEGLEFASFEEVIFTLESIQRQMDRLAQTFENGKIVFEGVTLCLTGAPNVGKSSLMNALLGKERAIVTHVPGTTRDVLEADLKLGGLHFRLVDTAGIRETEELVEQEGIRRSHQAVQEADLILLVLDSEKGVTDEDRHLMEIAPPSKTVVVWNKTDLPTPHPMPPQALPISAKNGTGLDTLQSEIEKKVWHSGPPSKEEIVITEHRHLVALTESIAAIQAVITGLRERLSPEFVASDIRRALTQLSTIIGIDVTEDILSAIFSKFCVGK